MYGRLSRRSPCPARGEGGYISPMTLRASLLAAALVLCTSALPAQELGTITFPTSGTPAAQALFIKGVVLLHSFEYGDARDVRGGDVQRHLKYRGCLPATRKPTT